jgi:hypothetical protein
MTGTEFAERKLLSAKSFSRREKGRGEGECGTQFIAS